MQSAGDDAMNKQRMANMELLRIIAMAMVIMLHYLSKGNLLPGMAGEIETNGYVAWVMETFSIVAVNVYMLISGYFLVGGRFKCSRLVQLLCQILFYSLLIPVVLVALGILNVQDITIYQLLHYIFPTQMEHYWFASAYVVMYLMMPVFRVALLRMKRNQLQVIIILLLAYISLSKSVLPVRLTADKLGYDAIWFLCVFLCAAYIRLYGIRWYGKMSRGIGGYLMGCAGILGITLVLRMLYVRTGMFQDVLTASYHYNHILNLFAAISLFYAFYHWRLPQGKLASAIVKCAPYTFGVYLLHEHVEIRYLWPKWFGASSGGNLLVFAFRSIITVLIVLAIGLIIDWMRSILFAWIGGLLKKTKAEHLLQTIDEIINGDSRLDEQEAERK